MSKFILTLLLVVTFNSSFSQTITWNKTYNFCDQDRANSIKQTSDNGYIVANTSGLFDDYDIWIFRLNENGDTVWTKSYGDENSQGANSIICSSDGNYVIVGHNSPSLNYYEFYIYVMKIDESGNILWEFDFPGSNQTAWDIIETSDGGYVVLGKNVAFIATQIILIKLDASGQLIWEKVYNMNSSISLMYEIIESNDFGFTLVGEKNTTNPGQDIWIMKTDQLGDSTWTKTIDFGGYDQGKSIKQLPNGDYILSANSELYEKSYKHLITYRLNSVGDIIWMNNINDESYTAESIIYTTDNCLLSIGRAYNQTYLRGIFVYKQNSFGDSIWMQKIEMGVNAYGFEVIQTNDEGYAICGSVSFSGSGSISDSWIIKLDEDGIVHTENKYANEKDEIFSISPNPTSNNLKIRFHNLKEISTNTIIEVYSIKGILAQETIIPPQNSNNINLDISKLKSGTYFMNLVRENKVSTKKFIVVK